MSAALSVVADRDLKAPAKAQTVAQRIQALQAEARDLARDHVLTLTAGMADLAQLATEIADLGDVVPPGIRDLARRLAEDLGAKANTINSITGKTS